MAELTVLYDEGCGVCTRLGARAARRPGIVAKPIGSAGGSVFLRDLAPEEQYAAFHVVDALGRRWSAGAALAPLLDELPGGAIFAALCRALPALTEHVYQLVARNRSRLAVIVRV